MQTVLFCFFPLDKIQHTKMNLFRVLCFIMTKCVFRSNLVEGINYAYIKTCLYHPTDSPLCPIFKLGDIVKLSGFNFKKIAKEVS